MASRISIGRVPDNIVTRIQSPSTWLIIPWRFLAWSRCRSLGGLSMEVDEIEKIVAVLGFAVSLPFE